MPTEKPSPLRAIAAGAVCGIAATLVMDQFLKLASSGQKALEKQEKLAHGESPWLIAHEQVEQQQKAAQKEDSTEIVARNLAEAAGYYLPEDQRKSAGRAVHYTFGTLMGVVFAVAAEYFPQITTGAGLPYGTLLFLLADEVAVPALHLSPPPTETPASNHLQHWAAHLVYGSSLELLRSLTRRSF
jgi:hypothetical protein